MAKQHPNARITGDKATSTTISPKPVGKKQKKVSKFDQIRQKYQKTDEPKPAPPQKVDEDKKKTPAAAPISSYSGGHLMRIATPSGSPPCSPEGYAGGTQPCYNVKDPWPKGQPSDQEIIDWAKKVRDVGIEHRNVYYTTDAIVYYMRYFWNIHSPRYVEVKQIIQSAFE